MFFFFFLFRLIRYENTRLFSHTETLQKCPRSRAVSHFPFGRKVSPTSVPFSGSINVVHSCRVNVNPGSTEYDTSFRLYRWLKIYTKYTNKLSKYLFSGLRNIWRRPRINSFVSGLFLLLDGLVRRDLCAVFDLLGLSTHRHIGMNNLYRSRRIAWVFVQLFAVDCLTYQ